MYKFLIKNGQRLALGLGILVVAIFLITSISGLGSSGYDVGTDLNKLTPEQKNAINFFNPGLGLTVLLTALAFFLAFVFFGVIDLLKFPKNAVKFGIGILVLLIIFFVIYSISDAGMSGPLAETLQEFNISENTSKMISAGIWTTIALAALAVVTAVISEIRNTFN